MLQNFVAHRTQWHENLGRCFLLPARLDVYSGFFISHMCLHTKPEAFTPIISNLLQNGIPQFTAKEQE